AKWRPSDPTSAHWYDEARLKRLMGAYTADDEDHGREPRFVSDFIGEFRGLSGSAKKKAVLEAASAARMTLPEFFANGSVSDLLAAMQVNSRPVQPKDIGEIGRDNLAACFEANGVDPATFEYKRIFGESNGLPYVVEVAFGYRPDGDGRIMVSGLNWSPAIINPFRQLGHFESLDSILAEQRCGHDEPLIFALHLACPRVSFTDHGKGAVAIDGRLAKDIKEAVLAVTRKWAKQRKAEERNAAAAASRRARLAGPTERHTVISAAAEIMEKAYMAASANGTLPAHARQVMYQARDYIQERTGEQLNDQYFCQTVLPDYIMDNGLDLAWDVVFDDRGHFTEPHTGRSIGLGTINVRNYLACVGEPELREAGISPPCIATKGPNGCYGAVMFCEKEGFDPLFKAVRLAERHDIGIMSTKGMSVTAMRRLIDELGVPVFVLHDFDKAGFSIIGTLRRNTRRYKFKNKVEIIDLGLRLADVKALGLEGRAERAFDKGEESARRKNLLLNGATEEEVEFLLHRRVELNALTSDQLIRFIEKKLAEHGIKKRVPPKAMLDDAYRLFARGQRIEEIVAEALAKKPVGIDVAAPSDIAERVRDYLADHPQERWDDAVAAIALKESSQ
ncbi:MAG TPA: hypothetical protein VIF39_09575, partial [Hyphomicrobium sp.]